MKLISNVIFLGAVAVFFLVIIEINLLGTAETRSELENRALAEAPEMTEESIADGSFFAGLEKYLLDHSAAREDFVRINTLIDIFAVRRPVLNNVVIRDNVLLPYLGYDEVDAGEIPRMADEITENLSEVSGAAESYGGHYYYVAAPTQFVSHEEDYPWYLDNRKAYTDEMLKVLKKKLSQAGVAFIDANEKFKADGNPSIYSSRVDNHYSIYGAFVTYCSIIERINEDWDAGLKELSFLDFDITEVPYKYVGSWERSLMNLKDLDECLFRLDLKEPVDFKITINGKPTATKVYYDPDPGKETVEYNYYMGGDNAETWIQTERPELPNVLIYGDSFTNPVECIIYNSFNEMRSIDMRHYEGGTVSDYILEHKPDYVLFIRNYEGLLLTNTNGGK